LEFELLAHLPYTCGKLIDLSLLTRSVRYQLPDFFVLFEKLVE
jgi:hypothetical protein